MLAFSIIRGALQQLTNKLSGSINQLCSTALIYKIKLSIYSLHLINDIN